MNKSDGLGGKHGNASAFHPKPARIQPARLLGARRFIAAGSCLPSKPSFLASSHQQTFRQVKTPAPRGREHFRARRCLTKQVLGPDGGTPTPSHRSRDRLPASNSGWKRLKNAIGSPARVSFWKSVVTLVGANGG
jgi:hypothetical protein